MANILDTAEGKRLEEDRTKQKYWKRWGSYVSDRQWGTVREDYSAGGGAWEDFSHDQARSRTYRWGEDGIAGISDNYQRICFAIALWNEKDPILKERLFGLTNSEGNHGEDVKEYYFYLDNTPTHSYMKFLYKYPQRPFPYNQLIQENAHRKSTNPSALEYELIDTGVFDDNRYFDVLVEYAKNSPEDIHIKISVTNRGPETAKLHLLPTIWLRNTWSWGYPDQTKEFKYLQAIKTDSNLSVIEAVYQDNDEVKNLRKGWLYSEAAKELLFTENETNKERFPNWGKNTTPYVKDGINNYILSYGTQKTVNPTQKGTKAAAHYDLSINPGETKVIKLRLSDANLDSPFGNDFETVFQTRQREADEFYQAVCPFDISEDMRNVQRQSFAGMLWSKQYYHYIVYDWLNGDPNQPKPPEQRKYGRNREWEHLFNEDIISMPDAWEYPWFAAWDLAFHTVTLALIDPEFAKKQLYLFTREWYMHPNGQIPAYEWAFGDVNPPVHAWAAWRVYNIEKEFYGKADRNFLEEIFQKLSLYFTWWVNRKDVEGNNLFQGGFLGLDNIGVLDRSNIQIPNATIEQSDGTSWMAMYCLNLLKIATELAKGDDDNKYEDMASKFFQHFLLIADAMNKVGGTGVDIWDEQDKFYYDILKAPPGVVEGANNEGVLLMRVRSMVGLIPLFAVETIEKEIVDKYLSSDFKKRVYWFIKNRPQLTQHDNVSVLPNQNGLYYLSLVNKERLKLILQRLVDEAEFLSDYGIRALSKYHKDHPYVLKANGQEYRVEYEPAESKYGMFGGNSNWRGPIWFPVNYLVIESLLKFHDFWGDDDSIKVMCSTSSGEKKKMNLKEVAHELSLRLIKIFLKDPRTGRRPVYGGSEKFQNDPHWRDLILFYEYFHGDLGAGIGASHQTGWTGLVAELIQKSTKDKI